METIEIPFGWQNFTLGDIASRDGYGLVDGPFGSNLPASDYVEFGIPVIRGSNLSLGIARFRDEEFVYVSKETAKRLERSLCQPGDIIFTKKGTLGQVGIIPINARFPCYLISSNQMKLTLDKKIASPQYIYYFVASTTSQEKIIRDSESTGVPKTNLAYLRKFPILIPPLPEQQAIAHILGSLDDKIELNRQMNETLEGIARALFKSWFVDFDPVRVKMEGHQPYGMDAETAELFPDGFESSALGEIPKGWRIGGPQSIADITMGQSPLSEAYNEHSEGLPFYQGIRDFGFRFPSRRVYCSSTGRIAERGDVLLSVRAPVGSLNIAVEQCIIGRGLAALRPKSKRSSFLYYLLKETQSIWDMFSASGTVFGSISKIDIQKFNVQLPPLEIEQRFNDLVDGIDGRVELNENEMSTLTSLRDTLLPKLLSGAIRVKEAEKVVGSVL